MAVPAAVSLTGGWSGARSRVAERCQPWLGKDTRARRRKGEVGKGSGWVYATKIVRMTLMTNMGQLCGTAGEKEPEIGFSDCDLRASTEEEVWET